MDGKTGTKFRIIPITINDNIEELSREYSQNPFVPVDDKKKIERCKEILNIQSCGLAKRLKTIGINKTVIGISGGLDSTLAFLVINLKFLIH
jgi:NAD+ synthase (glutamine-hydrolysing)